MATHGDVKFTISADADPALVEIRRATMALRKMRAEERVSRVRHWRLRLNDFIAGYAVCLAAVLIDRLA